MVHIMLHYLGKGVLLHQDITKTCLYNFDPLKPHFYIVKLGFTGVYIIFLISAQNIDCGYSLEPPRRGGSNECPQSMFWAEIRKISEFLSENFHFLVVKFLVYLNRRVFVMSAPAHTCAIAKAAITDCGFELIQHPHTRPISLHHSSIYSQSLKSQVLSGTHFQSDDDVIHAVEDFKGLL